MRDLATLPKGHLHIHLEAAMRPSTLAELAEVAGIPMPETRGFGSFAAFADMYVAACEVLRTPDDLARIVREIVEDAAADGATWLEPAFYPEHHQDRLGPPEQVLDIVLDACAAAEAEFGVGTGLLLAIDRTRDHENAMAQARLAERYAGRGVTSFGLHNEENGFPPELFVEPFAVAGAAGLIRAPHAGELTGAESVVGALDALGADRIQHGIRAIEDPELVRRLADSSVCLDVCPTSNVALSVVPDLASHPLPALLDAGVRCSVNADDPLLFGPGLLDEYELCRDQLGFDDARMAAIARHSIEASAAPDDIRRRSLAGIDAWLATPA
jgi:adenosine deaminase